MSKSKNYDEKMYSLDTTDMSGEKEIVIRGKTTSDNVDQSFTNMYINLSIIPHQFKFVKDKPVRLSNLPGRSIPFTPGYTITQNKKGYRHEIVPSFGTVSGDTVDFKSNVPKMEDVTLEGRMLKKHGGFFENTDSMSVRLEVLPLPRKIGVEVNCSNGDVSDLSGEYNLSIGNDITKISSYLYSRVDPAPFTIGFDNFTPIFFFATDATFSGSMSNPDFRDVYDNFLDSTYTCSYYSSDIQPPDERVSKAVFTISVSVIEF